MTTQTQKRTHRTSTNKDLYNRVNQRIIDSLEQGIIPWRKPWNSYGLARNYATGHVYSGINMLLMNNTKHAIPYFMTYKQVKEQGGKIAKGSKAEKVFYFNFVFKDADNNKITRAEAAELRRKGVNYKVLRFIKYYNVFNVQDIEGIEFEFPEIPLNEIERIERCEQLISDFPSPPKFIQEDANRAYYHGVYDYFNLPNIRQFASAEDYYATCFHELAHATGHEKRLNRPAIMQPCSQRSKEYAIEELVAEIAASYVCASVRIDFEPIMENTAAYLQSWLKLLKADRFFIFKVTAEAQKAADWILGTYGK